MPSCICHRALLAAALIGSASSMGCGQRALEWVEEDGYRWAELHVSGEITPGFQQLAESETGISFTNTVTEAQYIENSHYLNGSGVALGDVDGDGLVDIYFASMDGPNALYRNLGDWKFEDIAAQAGVAAADRFSTGAVFAASPTMTSVVEANCRPLSKMISSIWNNAWLGSLNGGV